MIGMSAAHVRELVVVGSAAAAWMTATALGRAVAGTNIRISIVDTPVVDHGVGPCGGVEATLASFPTFLPWLGVDEEALLQASACAFSLGTEQSGWTAEDFFLPFGSTGAPIGPIAFHQLVLRLRELGTPVRLADYSLAALAARAGRFARPSPDPRSPLSSLGYGLHLDLDRFTATLRDGASRAGVTVVRQPFSSIERRTDGGIASLILADGTKLEGDFFFDCSGEQALLSTRVSPDVESWARWLPFNRMLSKKVPGPSPSPLHSTHQAEPAGWRRSVPLPSATHQSLFFSSEHLSEDQARIEGTVWADASMVRFEAGVRRQPWTANCLAIGSAALSADPLARTRLHLVQTAIQRFLRLFPASASGVEAREYNRLAAEEAAHLRDFLILPHKLNHRTGEPLWDACRAMTVPDSLAHKIALYEARGRVPLHDGETFETSDWVTMLDGLGVRPRRHDPFADGLPLDQVRHHLGRLSKVLGDAVLTMPPHSEFNAREAS